MQGSIRLKNCVGLSIAGVHYGEHGVSLAAITNAILLPLGKMLCTSAFARYGTKPLSVKGTLRSVSTNPPILTGVLGIAINLMGLGLPLGAADLVGALGSASFPGPALRQALNINSVSKCRPLRRSARP